MVCGINQFEQIKSMMKKVEFKMELNGQFYDYINVLSWLLNLVSYKERELEEIHVINNFMASIEKKNGAAYLVRCQFNTQMSENNILNVVKFICDGDEDNEYLSQGKHVFTRYINGSFTYSDNKYAENVQYCYR